MSESNKTEQFVRLLAGSEHEIYRYILGLVHNTADAQDIAQETAVALWRKFDQFDVAEPFVPWACRFAWFEVLKYRKQQRSRGVVLLSDKALDMLAAERLEEVDDLDARRGALADCLKKLSSEDHQLLQTRYRSSDTVRQMANQSGRNIHTLYKSLARIRRQLHDCIDQASQKRDGA